ncbi:phosphoribosylamine--glycine ligase [Candidatus Woesearchaeota archaeon]|nr:phosphoribosylamine--glycine ligase [Candidatus Woesearchaeota archaeon]
MTKVLVIGRGGREHALGWRLGKDKEGEVLYAPGNAGTEIEPETRNVDIKEDDFDGLTRLVKTESIDLVVVGPEGPLANGLVDHFYERGIRQVFGPTKAGARIEADKFYSFEVMRELGIPQAHSSPCEEARDIEAAVRTLASENGVVLKARGLHGGKGVRVYDSAAQAIDDIFPFISEFGDDVLVSERLFGEEFSVFGISDGTNVHLLPVGIQDHKRLRENDQGPNTGGMGAYGPASVADLQTLESVRDDVMIPVVQCMNDRGTPYIGFFYAGMMMTKEGPKALEFNCRLGDPETQVLMMLLEGDLYRALSSAVQDDISSLDLSIREGAALGVVLASQGYPGKPVTGKRIYGLGDIKDPNVKVFHMGTKVEEGNLVTGGGRVLCVTAYGVNLGEARKRAYQAAGEVKFDDMQYRIDIGAKALRGN